MIQKYKSQTIWLHWLSAALILLALPTGLMMDEEGPTDFKLLLYRFHFSSGLIVAALGIVRTYFAYTSERPANLYESGLKHWLVKIAYNGMYAALLIGSIMGIISIIRHPFIQVAISGDWSLLPLHVDDLTMNAHRLASQVFFFLLILHLAGTALHFYQHGKKTFERIV